MTATVAIWIACAFICFGIAKQKGKNEWVALGIGIFFGLFAVLGYILAKGSKEYQVKKAQEKIKSLSK